MRYMVMGKRTVIGLLLIALCILVALSGGAGRAVQTAAAAKKKIPIYSVDILDQKVSLGINCAWDDSDIPVLLEILGHYNVKATFFIVGDWCEKYPESVLAIYQAGHEIGSHSDTHADMTRLDKEGILREIRQSCDRIQAVTGQRPELFRPPSGSWNNAVVETIEAEGLYAIQWDCDSIDYRDPTPGQMQDRILKKLQNGSILLFHSGAKNTPAALPQIIEAIQAQGYQFVPVGELIYRDSYSVDFEGRQHAA